MWHGELPEREWDRWDHHAPHDALGKRLDEQAPPEEFLADAIDDVPA
jgi:hypothetical protein